MTEPNDAATVPRLKNGFRLQWEPAQEAFVLLYPEGMIQLNEAAGEILRRCEGRLSVGGIIADLAEQYDGEDLTDDVHAFLGAASQHGWIQLDCQP
jgi:pyrroloquinoline quinone biosynthesis protein D